MNPISATSTVGSLITQNPALSRVFEKLGIDYCCGGKQTLEDACRKKGLESATVITMLDAIAPKSSAETTVDISEMSLTELANHIESTHHAFLHSELPRLAALTNKVATVHGAKEPALSEIRNVFADMANELSSHMMKEERILFPFIRDLEAAETAPDFHCGSLSNPIEQMEHEHDVTGAALKKLRELTNGFTPPDWACNTYRAMLDGIATVERDLHLHIHKENNVLFPKAIDMEEAKSRLGEGCGCSCGGGGKHHH